MNHLPSVYHRLTQTPHLLLPIHTHRLWTSINDTTSGPRCTVTRETVTPFGWSAVNCMAKNHWICEKKPLSDQEERIFSSSHMLCSYLALFGELEGNPLGSPHFLFQCWPTCLQISNLCEQEIFTSQVIHSNIHIGYYTGSRSIWLEIKNICTCKHVHINMYM